MRKSGVRFAPSPTGAFHVGNLRTAWISHLWARTLGQPWIVRFEDIDQPRVLRGAREGQLRDLLDLDLSPDQVTVQSSFARRHRALFEKAVASGQVYPCFCSRKEVQAALEGMASAPHASVAAYGGKCRNAAPASAARPAASPIAWRFRNERADGTEDFIVGRANPDASAYVPSYHWACAIDDCDGRYSLLVRACDLESATPIQRAVRSWVMKAEGTANLGHSAVFHAALVVQDDGHRLEKRTRGVTWTELQERGVSRDRLIGIFDSSFDRSLIERNARDLDAQVLGENSKRISLSDLGLGTVIGERV